MNYMKLCRESPGTAVRKQRTWWERREISLKPHKDVLCTEPWIRRDWTNDDSPLSSYKRCTTEEPETAEASPTAARADESDDSLSMNSLVTMQNLKKNQIVLKLSHTKESLSPASEVQNAIMPATYGLVTYEKSFSNDG